MNTANRNRVTYLTGLIAVFLALLLPTAAGAATLITPTNGDTVSSLPKFTFDFDSSKWAEFRVELSKFPETLNSGEDAGSFVNAAYSDVWDWSNYGPLDEIGQWRNPSYPINAGRYYWHYWIREDINNPTAPWSPVMVLYIEDDPVKLDGWYIRAYRLKKKTRKCKSRVLLRGKYSYSDNDNENTKPVRWALRIRAGGRTLRKSKGTNKFSLNEFKVKMCTRRTKLTAKLSLTDEGGNTAHSQKRKIRVKRLRAK